MIWVLVAISLKFSADGELQAARAISIHKDAATCEKIKAYAREEILKAHPKAVPVLSCVPMKREANA
jgi:hypothetical protein